jgi:hypothetical protein
LFKNPFLIQISNCLILQDENEVPTGILGTPVPLSELRSMPLEATVATLLYDASKTFPDGEVPLWHPAHEVCIIGHIVPEKVTGFIVSQTSPQFSFRAPYPIHLPIESISATDN